MGKARARRLSDAGFRVFAGVRKERDGQQLRDSGWSGVTPVILDVTQAPTIAGAGAPSATRSGRMGSPAW
jgi:NADP-dependent 3-hydroxy acid dehydrogenase YdfG